MFTVRSLVGDEYLFVGPNHLLHEVIRLLQKLVAEDPSLLLVIFS